MYELSTAAVSLKFRPIVYAIQGEFPDENVLDLIYVNLFENFHIEWLKEPTRDIMLFNSFFTAFSRDPSMLLPSSKSFLHTDKKLN